ncbi:MAG: rane protein [Hyphomicrobiales bacterium]|nr:rane protein [Hyphomicrobiales bacterium]
MLKRIALRLAVLVGLVLAPQLALAQQSTHGSLSDTYSSEELVNTGSAFFGSVAQGLATLIEKSVSQFGLPNGYILGDEASGAFFGGARYGQGTMYTRNAGDLPIYWQGPTLGLDFGGDGSKVMMLVYNLNSVNDVFGRFPGANGSAYVIGGLGMTVVKRGNVVMVPIRSGVGARLGVNVGYLKFTDQPTWNPF